MGGPRDGRARAGGGARGQGRGATGELYGHAGPGGAGLVLPAAAVGALGGCQVRRDAMLRRPYALCIDFRWPSYPLLSRRHELKPLFVHTRHVLQPGGAVAGVAALLAGAAGGVGGVARRAAVPEAAGKLRRAAGGLGPARASLAGRPGGGGRGAGGSGEGGAPRRHHAAAPGCSSAAAGGGVLPLWCAAGATANGSAACLLWGCARRGTYVPATNGQRWLLRLTMIAPKIRGNYKTVSRRQGTTAPAGSGAAARAGVAGAARRGGAVCDPGPAAAAGAPRAGAPAGRGAAPPVPAVAQQRPGLPPLRTAVLGYAAPGQEPGLPLRVARAECIRDVCSADGGKGAEYVREVQAGLADPHPAVQEAAMDCIALLCEDDTLDFYPAWRVVHRAAPTLPAHRRPAAAWVSPRPPAGASLVGL